MRQICTLRANRYKFFNSHERLLDRIPLGTPLPKNSQARFPLSKYIFQGTIRKVYLSILVSIT